MAAGLDCEFADSVGGCFGEDLDGGGDVGGGAGEEDAGWVNAFLLGGVVG